MGDGCQHGGVYAQVELAADAPIDCELLEEAARPPLLRQHAPRVLQPLQAQALAQAAVIAAAGAHMTQQFLQRRSFSPSTHGPALLQASRLSCQGAYLDSGPVQLGETSILQPQLVHCPLHVLGLLEALDVPGCAHRNGMSPFPGWMMDGCRVCACRARSPDRVSNLETSSRPGAPVSRMLNSCRLWLFPETCIFHSAD